MIYRLLLYTLCLLPSAVCAQDIEVIRLPKTTVEFAAEQDGKVLGRKEITGLGAFGLHWLPETDPPRPPRGYKEKRFQEVLTVQKKKIETTCIEWTPKANATRNFRARKIAQWIAKGHGSPPFRFGLSGPDWTIYPNSVKFEHLPDPVDPKFPTKRLATLRGQWTGTKKITVLGKAYIAFKYSFEWIEGKNSMRGDLWVSSGVPGSIYERRVEGKIGKRNVTSIQRIKRIELEPAPKGLTLNRKGMFATKVPKGWKTTAPKIADEVLRLVPAGENNLGTAVSIEVRPAKRLNRQQWVAKLSKGYFVSPNGVGLGDVPASSAQLAGESKNGASQRFCAAVYANKLYILSLWQRKVPRGQFVDRTAFDQVIRSWRWLRKK